MAADPHEPDDSDSPEAEPVRFTDKRKVDPETGHLRDDHVASEGEADPEDRAAAVHDPVADPLEEAERILADFPVEDSEDRDRIVGEQYGENGDPITSADAAGTDFLGDEPLVEGEPELDVVDGEHLPGVTEAEVLDPDDPRLQAPESDTDARVAELETDLRRLQAEYVNYRRRVDRDRAVEKDRVKGGLIAELMPILDDISAARQAGDLLDGPFAHIATRLETALTQQGLETVGEAGQAFDPNEHEAIMQQPDPQIAADHVAVVVRSGYRYGDRLLRAAQVIVSTGAPE